MYFSYTAPLPCASGCPASLAHAAATAAWETTAQTNSSEFSKSSASGSHRRAARHRIKGGWLANRAAAVPISSPDTALLKHLTSSAAYDSNPLPMTSVDNYNYVICWNAFGRLRFQFCPGTLPVFVMQANSDLHLKRYFTSKSLWVFLFCFLNCAQIWHVGSRNRKAHSYVAHFPVHAPRLRTDTRTHNWKIHCRSPKYDINKMMSNFFKIMARCLNVSYFRTRNCLKMNL